MRIAEINMTHTGSTGKIMFQIAEAARKAGHEVWTFSPQNFNRQKKEETPPIEHHMYFGNRLENMIHNYTAKFTGFQGFLSRHGTAQLIKALEEIQPEIIHLHNLHNRSICLPMLFDYIKNRKVKVVWTLHDCWAFTGQCPHFVVAKCDKWKTGCYGCTQIHGYPDAWIDQTKFMWKMKKNWFGGIENMTLVSPSEWLLRLTRESFLKEYPVHRIYSGINLKIFHPTYGDFREKYHLEDKHILLGVAFAWGERKGLDVFIRLAKELDDSYQIVLVGTDKLTDEQLPDNIISIHRTANQQELAVIYSAADVFVNPTREEVLGLVNIEALACGTPVITSNAGGSPECVDESSGIVVSCEDVDAFKEAVRYCVSCKPFTKEQCIERAKAFDQKDRYREYVDLYNEISKGK